MPKRVIDFDALWASDKIAACADWAQAEYAWLYGLADASGCFELTNLRVIWGRVSAVRKNLTLERLTQIIDEFIARGLLFTWEENGKRYGHWTGSDVPGRLPAPSWRARLERLAPPIPRAELAAYSARFASRRGPSAACEVPSRAAAQSAECEPANAASATPEASSLQLDLGLGLGLNLGLEVPQAQDRNLNLDLNLNEEWKQKQRVCGPRQPNAAAEESAEDQSASPERLLEIYEAECGVLPCAERLTPERRQYCELRLRAGLTPAEFRLAVRRAAQTPFLAGGGERGWRANFDWFIGNDTNIRRVLEGCYEPHVAAADFARATQRGPSGLYAGAAPSAGLCGAHVKPATLERIRARDAAARLARVAQTADSETQHASNDFTDGENGRSAATPTRVVARDVRGITGFARHAAMQADRECAATNGPERAGTLENRCEEKAS